MNRILGFISTLLLLFATLSHSLSISEVNIETVKTWTEERSQQGWSPSFEATVLKDFTNQLKLKLNMFIKQTVLTGTHTLFEQLIVELSKLEERENIYSELIALSYKTAFFLTLHHMRIGSYHKYTYWGFLTKNLTNEQAQKLDFTRMVTSPNNFNTHIASVIQAPFIENDFKSFDTTFVKNLLNQEDIYLVPTMEELDISIFIHLSPLKVYPLGLTFKAINEADGERWSPHVFFDHDLRHAALQSLNSKGSTTDNYIAYRNTSQDLKILKASHPFEKAVQLTLFHLLHEKGYSFCSIADSPLFSNPHDEISLLNERVTYNIYPFEKTLWKKYRSQAIEWLRSQLPLIQCQGI